MTYEDRLWAASVFDRAADCGQPHLPHWYVCDWQQRQPIRHWFMALKYLGVPRVRYRCEPPDLGLKSRVYG